MYYRCNTQRCHHFGDCCINVPDATQKPDYQKGWKCHQIDKSNDHTGMVVVDTCAPDASAAEKESCAKGGIGEWSLYGWLVTDSETMITYVSSIFRFKRINNY